MRLIACTLLPVALVFAIACGPTTPEDLYDQADAAFNQQDAVETELLLDRLFKMENVAPDLAIRAHMLRGANYLMGLNDMERAREELRSALEIATIDSDEGVMAAIYLARSYLPSDGIEGFDRVIDEQLAQLPPDSPRALNIHLARFSVLSEMGASNEMVEMYEPLFAQIASAEQVPEPDRRGVALDLTRVRVEIARAADDPEGAIDALENFIDRYPGSDPAMFMPFEIASAEYTLGRTAQADARVAAAFASYEQRFLAAETSAEQATVILMRADAHMALDNFDAASGEFNTIFDEYLDYQMRPNAMGNWTVQLMRRNRCDEARALAMRLATDYPNTQFNAMANQLIQQIDASAETTVPEALEPEIASPEIDETDRSHESYETYASPEASPIEGALTAETATEEQALPAPETLETTASEESPEEITEPESAAAAEEAASESP